MWCPNGNIMVCVCVCVCGHRPASLAVRAVQNEPTAAVLKRECSQPHHQSFTGSLLTQFFLLLHIHTHECRHLLTNWIKGTISSHHLLKQHFKLWLSSSFGGEGSCIWIWNECKSIFERSEDIEAFLHFQKAVVRTGLQVRISSRLKLAISYVRVGPHKDR